ncbi:MAG TPA: sensor histidine kinase KdpD [Gemmatimonadota bacterium]
MTRSPPSRDPAERRPDPDALLAQIRAESPATAEGAERPRGRLKVFLGAAPGVGKTYAMLEAAQARRREGVDVIVGVVETHGRAETERLLAGLEAVPRRRVEHRGIGLTEFDLDGALARRPGLILVDELAHTNAPGSRHAKRWQDVEELLRGGISVYTTVNVQHLESLNDLVAQVTHVIVRETVPDSVVEAADEIELVDLPPEELLERLAEGKVYVPELIGRAAENFFRKGNLIALRQLALRHVADRVDVQMEVYRRAHAAGEVWPVHERLVVAVGPDPTSRRLIRAAKRMADRLGAEWTAVAVETPGFARLSEDARGMLWESLRLAERLGGRTAVLSGTSAAEEVLAYARRVNASRVVLGKPTHPRWRDILLGSTVDDVVRGSGDVDVHVLAGIPEEFRPPGAPRPAAPTRWGRYAAAIAAVVATTTLAAVLRPVFELTNLVMVYLLVVVLVAIRIGRGPAVVASILSVAAFDFFFVPPFLTFAVADTEYVVTFAVMLFVALVISTLTSRLGHQVEAAQRRERRTAALYEIGRDLVRARDAAEALSTALRHARRTFETEVIALVPDGVGDLQAWSPDGSARSALEPQEDAVARWVFDHGRSAGAGTDTLAGARRLYVPLTGSGRTVGVLGVHPDPVGRFADPEQMHLLETVANQVAITLERAQLAEAARRREGIEATGRLRSEFAALQSERLGFRIAPESARELVQGAVSAALPEAARLGADLQWTAPESLPHVLADAPRIRGVLSELLGGALRRIGPGGRILVAAEPLERDVLFSVADNGEGIPAEEQARVFADPDGAAADEEDGGGSPRIRLGAAARVVRAHGGLMWLDSLPGPTVASFTLPSAAAVATDDRPAAHPST